MLADLGWLALAWLGYFLIHSLLAADFSKRWVGTHWPRLMPAYRLVYNLLAVLLLALPLYFTLMPDEPPLWQWHGAWRWLADGLALAALLGFVYSLRYYDGGVFTGLSQWRRRAGQVEEPGDLRISPLHRHVRHPWYSLGLVLLWTRDMNAPMLLSSLLITLYFVFGSRLEERKLEQRYGEAYATYRRAVPGLLPRPWRRLAPHQASALEARGRNPDSSGWPRDKKMPPGEGGETPCCKS